MKRRCMIMACKKKSVEDNEGIYLCKGHRSKKLDSNKEYLLKDMRKVKFIEPEEEKCLRTKKETN